MVGDGGAQNAAHTVRSAQRHEKERGRFARCMQRSDRVGWSRSLAPGLGPSHGADAAWAREDTVRGAGGEKQSELGKVVRGPHEIDGLLRGGWRSYYKAPAAWCLRMRGTTCVDLGPLWPWAPEAPTRLCAGRSAVLLRL